MSKRPYRGYERRRNSKRNQRPKSRPQTHIERLFKDAGKLLGSIERGMGLVSQAANDICVAARQVRSDCNSAFREFRKKHEKIYEAEYTVLDHDDEEEDE